MLLYAFVIFIEFLYFLMCICSINKVLDFSFGSVLIVVLILQ